MVSLALWMVAATAVLAFVVAGLAWQQQPNAGARSFAIGMAGIALWLGLMFFGYLLVPSNPTVGYLLFRLEAIGAVLMAVYWFRFALEFTGRGEYVTRRVMMVLWVFPAIGVPIGLGATSFLELYASVFGVELSLPPWDLWHVYEPFGFVYLYVLIGAGFALILGLVVNRRLARPELASLWLVAAFVPMVVGILYLADVFDPLDGIDPTPMGFVVSGIVGLAAISRYDIFESAPVARNYVLDHLEAGMLVFDDTCRLVDYNEWAASVFELESAIGEDVRAVFETQVNEPIPRDCSATAFADVLDGAEVTVTERDETKHLSVDVSPIERSGGLRYGYAILLYDITTQRRYQQEVDRQNERLERLANVVSHDLRNPLDVGLGQGRRLNQDLQNGEVEAVDTEQCQRRSEAIVDSINRATVIVENMLAMTRGGQQLTDPETVDLVEIASMAWTYVDTTDVELVVEGSCVTVGDRNRLEQVFENLYRNTIVHAPEATEIRVGPIEGGIYVEDDGPGIPADRRDEIFQPGRTTHPDGTGLGLSIVHEIVHAHGWTISVTDAGGSDESSESETREADPSTGARFEIVELE